MIFLLGPTASGKSRLAMEVAQKAGVEIVSLDAFQIYRGLDIGTAKPTRREREKIPHHLLDLVQPEETFSSADYKREAEKVLADLRNRNQKALWVGGTGLYHRIMTRGLSTAPRTDQDIAEQLEKMSTQQMVEEIRKVDPDWAKEADLQNRRRIVRALAVWRQSGRAMSDWQKKETAPGHLSGIPCFVLMPRMESLAAPITKRVGQMLEAGWVEEVRGLLKRNGWRGSPGSRAIGYEQVSMIVDGKIGQREACDKIVAETRAYAKRQLTWFRGLPNFRTIEIDPQLCPLKTTVETLVNALSR